MMRAPVLEPEQRLRRALRCSKLHHLARSAKPIAALVSILLGLCAVGCDRGSSALAERVEGYCTQVTARFTSWASAPAQMGTPMDPGGIGREVSFCLRVREGEAEPLVQQVSEHLDALVTSEPADAKRHLDAILELLNDASRRPLVR